MKILLDYVFPISVITPTPQASTGFLKQVCVIAKPKAAQAANVGTIFTCTTPAQVALLTDNQNSLQLFNAGMSKVYVLLSNTLDVTAALSDGAGSDFYTLLVSDDFADNDMADAFAGAGISVTAFANLTSGVTPDSVSIAGVAFTAQAGAVTVGQATFQAGTSNEATATSLAAQINAYPSVSALVSASVVGNATVITANEVGTSGNNLAISYIQNDINPGITLNGVVDGKLSGGAGLVFGTFKGVVGISSADEEFCATQAAIEDRSCFFTNATNGANNLFYAFGKLLSNPSNWVNQQYITMPFNDGVELLGDTNTYFDDKVSFVIHDDEFGNRLALFTAGGKAIVAPYILKNMRIDLQSASLTWISGNQPQYTMKEATLLENRLQEDVINSYIDRSLIEDGVIEITLLESNFVAKGSIDVSEPKALWRVYSEMKQTL